MRSGYFSVAFRMNFAPGRSVEISLKKSGEVPAGGVCKQQLLGKHASGRKDLYGAVLLCPTRESLRDVRENFSAKLTGKIAMLPDLPLERFQRRRLHVVVY
jgi:hypothetical protein